MAASESEALREKDFERFGEDRFFGQPNSVERLGSQESHGEIKSPFQLSTSYVELFYSPIPRVSQGISTTPLVLHLIRRGDSGNAPSDPVRFRINSAFLGDAPIESVDLVAVEWEGDAPASVQWNELAEGDWEITVEGIRAWAVLAVRIAEAIQSSSVEEPSLREQVPASEVLLMRMIRFDDHWGRPEWVDELLASPEDPLDGYFIDRVSWSYDSTENTINHAQERGWSFHGSVALMHTWMEDTAITYARQGGLLSFPTDWTGWVRHPNGTPMLIRAEWNPPR
jgi:hypothetical protein